MPHHWQEFIVTLRRQGHVLRDRMINDLVHGVVADDDEAVGTLLGALAALNDAAGGAPLARVRRI